MINNLQIILLILLFQGSSKPGEFYSLESARKFSRIVLKDRSILLETVDTKAIDFGDRAIRIFRFKNSEKFEEGLMVFTQAKGRYDYFDYMVVVSNKPDVLLVRLLKYRSEKGGEISSKKWLSQFVGYSSGELRYKKEISAISGATISAKSLTDDISLVMQLVHDHCKSITIAD